MDKTDPIDVTEVHRSDSSSHDDADSSEHPQRIGRYLIETVLGKGGFGTVYLAFDEQLKRRVAIKIPSSILVPRPEDAEAYLQEARTVANLDHPHIVPVFDMGSTEQFPCFIISKYIDGQDLAEKVKAGPLPYQDAASLVATVAEALHYAHKQGLVHRDVKPGNILLDREGLPYVVDFGLALREESIGQGPRYAGTPSYMSPEQARGEGHRVDGRSDIFSLGIVLYQLLSGRQPFRAEVRADLLAQIVSGEEKPLRQYDEQIPKELERICQKAMSKRASDRYRSAHDMAEDLQQFLASQTIIDSERSRGSALSQASNERSANTPRSSLDPNSADLGSSGNRPLKIVPKGLRSFDAHDADFFLELIPGPRDRNGLPESLRFWKSRLEAINSEETFSVGLLYGPSGCGKSSLIKAGLLPQLSDDVIPVYVESDSEATETRILRRLRDLFPSLDRQLNLKDSLAAIRRGDCLPFGKKVVLVLDQFEQWLHTHGVQEESDLVHALRQCDGQRLQCIIMVRDDFWMAVTRFGQQLEIDFRPGDNMAAVDLFPTKHAEKVLTAFGCAFEVLPNDGRKFSKEQKDFIKQAVNGLANDGKVICVRLALFAEMMSTKEWSPATLRAVGGTSGVGVTFLEETFSAPTAHAHCRLHELPARAVLQALLPESGTHIKGHMKSYDALLAVSGYKENPKLFAELMRILDSQVRLVSPTDPEGIQVDENAEVIQGVKQKYYQLTHDYLVDSLRAWLTLKQKATRKGRAELRLAERAADWNQRRERRLLPSFTEYLQIRMHAPRQHWTDSQHEMMRRAGRIHMRRISVIAMLVLMFVFGGYLARRQSIRSRQAAEASRLVEGLLQADTSQVSSIIDDLESYRSFADRDLREAYEQSPITSNAKLHAALAILPQDSTVLPFLKEQLLQIAPSQFAQVRDALQDHRASLVDDYWSIASNPEEAASRRFHAICALATFDSKDQRWQDESFSQFVAEHLVSVLPSELLAWRNALYPVKRHLASPLTEIYQDGSRDAQTLGFATDTLLDYQADNAPALFELLVTGNEKQFGMAFDRIAAHRLKAIELGREEIARTSPATTSDLERERLAKRQANAAVMLWKMGEAEQMWHLLKRSPDPTVRSFVIDWFASRGGDTQILVDRFNREDDASIKTALLLSLGEATLSESLKQSVLEQLLEVYQGDSDPGVHAAAEWLLRTWVEKEKLASLDQQLSQNEAQRLKSEEHPRNWYLNSKGQTFAILEAGEFLMGSPEFEIDRRPDEFLHRRQIGRRLGVATKEVTRGQWREFSSTHPVLSADNESLVAYLPTDDCPMTGINWYDAAYYCNWLSQQEGIPEDQWCYEPNSQGLFRGGMKAKENFYELTGYRLPTEAEWEFVCRAGTSSVRFFGVSESLLSRYAWNQLNAGNQAHPVGRLKPNDFGLFDTMGNAYEWCFDIYQDNPFSSTETVQDQPDVAEVNVTDRRVLRGAAFDYSKQYLRSSYRLASQADSRDINVGFRPVRTMP